VSVQFKDHISNYSSLVHSLHDLLPNYSKRDGGKPVAWAEETKTLFRKVKEAVRDCPKLFFVDEHASVFLHTDASDDGFKIRWASDIFTSLWIEILTDVAERSGIRTRPPLGPPAEFLFFSFFSFFKLR